MIILSGKFNNSLAQKAMVMWEEASALETSENADKLKALITQETAMLERKYFDAVRSPLCALIFITANHIHQKIVNVEGGDRRFVVVRGKSEHMAEDPDYFTRLFGKMSDKTYMRAVFDFLRARDISKYKSGRDWARLRPVTETYEAMQEASKRPITHSFKEIAEHLVGEAETPPWAGIDDDRHFSQVFPTPPSSRPGAPTETIQGHEFRANDLHKVYVH